MTLSERSWVRRRCWRRVRGGIWRRIRRWSWCEWKLLHCMRPHLLSLLDNSSLLGL